MRPYGSRLAHCSAPGHGTLCEVAEEKGSYDSPRAVEKRRWLAEVQADASSALSPEAGQGPRDKEM